MRKFKVAVFRHGNKYMAYTKWYSESWDGCRIYYVDAKNGTEAKKIAIKMAKVDDEPLSKSIMNMSKLEKPVSNTG